LDVHACRSGRSEDLRDVSLHGHSYC
jgi:hypothetical protein